MAAEGFNTFATQVIRGAAETAFEFGAYIGRGRAAQLVIPEVKDVAGAVRASSLTAMGLGRSGIATFQRNISDLVNRLRRLPIDDLTKRTLIRQAQSGTFEVRLFGNEAKATVFPLNVRSQLRAATGSSKTAISLVRNP
jgi:hypothetical protein